MQYSEFFLLYLFARIEVDSLITHRPKKYQILNSNILFLKSGFVHQMFIFISQVWQQLLRAIQIASGIKKMIFFVAKNDNKVDPV